MNGPWCAPSPAEDPPLSTESSGGGGIGCHPPVEDTPAGGRVDVTVDADTPPPLTGLAAWFHGTYKPAPLTPEDGWCECDKVPNRPGSMTNRHVHWTCWQCGTEVICVSVYGYTCDNCDVAQNAMSNCKPDPNFDYDAAAAWLNP